MHALAANVHLRTSDDKVLPEETLYLCYSLHATWPDDPSVFHWCGRSDINWHCTRDIRNDAWVGASKIITNAQHLCAIRRMA